MIVEHILDLENCLILDEAKKPGKKGSSAGEAAESLVGVILLKYRNKIPNVVPDEAEIEELLQSIASDTESDKGGHGFKQPGEEAFLRTDAVIVASFSAAATIAKNYSTEVMKMEMIWRVGRKWPAELEAVGLTSVGGKDYNSADLVIQVGGAKDRKYLGISLKIKPTATHADPPLINKALSSMLEKGAKEELVDVMNKSFNTHVSKVINILKEKAGKQSKISKNIEILQTYRDFYSKKLIGVNIPANIVKDLVAKKGKGNSNLPSLPCKAFIQIVLNEFLHNKSNPFYIKLRETLKPIEDKVASEIYDVIFKPQIENLTTKGGEIVDYNLILVTGFQKLSDADAEGQKIILGEVHEYNTMYSILHNLSTEKLEITFLDAEVDESEGSDEAKGTSATIHMQLSKGSLLLANMTLRFKGDFKTLTMAFMATLSNKFKDVLKTPPQEK